LDQEGGDRAKALKIPNLLVASPDFLTTKFESLLLCLLQSPQVSESLLEQSTRSENSFTLESKLQQFLAFSERESDNVVNLEQELSNETPTASPNHSKVMTIMAALEESYHSAGKSYSECSVQAKAAT